MTTPPSRSPSPDAEILVHIAAPSRVSDDAVYRQLAQAYLAFQPESRTRVSLSEPQQAVGDVSSYEHKQVPAQCTTSPSGGSASVAPGQSFEVNSMDLSFQSALDNRTSPPLRFSPARDVIVPSSQETNLVGSQASWFALPSEISDSYPMPDQTLLQISPTRVLEQYIGRLSSPHPSSTSPSPSRPPSRRPAPSPDPDTPDVPSSLPEPDTGEPDSLDIQVPGYIRINKTIPVTPLVSKTTSVPKSSIDSISIAVDESLLDTTHISSSGASEPSHRAGSEPPPAKRSKITQLHHSDLVRSSSDSGPIASSGRPQSSNSIAVELSNSLEIRPPSPPVGVADIDPAEFVSAKMAKLAQDLPSHYDPDVRREVDPLERGYWLLDCSTWAPEARFSAWVFLNNYLRNGHAGWGTWCRRDNSHDWLRLYCWGHVAKHMYLVLYVASKRLVKCTGAKWYGADGTLVLNVFPS